MEDGTQKRKRSLVNVRDSFKKIIVVRDVVNVRRDDVGSKIVSLTDKAYAEQKELEALGNKMEDLVTKNLTTEEKKQLILLLKKLLGE